MSQGSALRDISEVPDLNDDDHAFLQVLSDFMKQHGQADRFGIALLHRHDHAHTGADDEVLVEFATPGGGSMTTVSMPRSEIPADARPTILARGEDGIPKPVAYCSECWIHTDPKPKAAA